MVRFSEGEEVILKIHPSLKPSFGKIFIGLLILLPGLYYYLYGKINIISYIFYFFGVLVILHGLSDLVVALRTTYYVTNMRILKEYRSPMKLEVTEIPIGKIRGIETRKGFWEVLFKLGQVVVASGAGRYFEIRFRYIDNAEKVAEEIRSLLK